MHFLDYVIILLVAAIIVFAAVSYFKRDKSKDGCQRCKYRNNCPSYNEPADKCQKED